MGDTLISTPSGRSFPFASAPVTGSFVKEWGPLSFSSLFSKNWGEIKDFIEHKLFPFVDSKSFKTVYPLLIISLALLAATGADALRTAVVVTALLLLLIVLAVAIYRISKKLKLRLEWNFLVWGHYRKYFIDASRRTTGAFRGKLYIDFSIFRDSDLLQGLRSAESDFASGRENYTTHAATFDVEYLPYLVRGINVLDSTYRIRKLEAFLKEDVLNRAKSVNTHFLGDVREYLERCSRDALPLRWGTTGIFVDESAASRNADIFSEGKAGVCLTSLLKALAEGRTGDTSIIVLDWWLTILGLISLHLRGEPTFGNEDAPAVREMARELLTAAVEFEADPVALRRIAKNRTNLIVVGGGTWLAPFERLYPVMSKIAAQPAWLGYCECLGFLETDLHERPKRDTDAAALTAWLLDHPTMVRGSVPDSGLPSYGCYGRKANAQLDQWRVYFRAFPGTISSSNEQTTELAAQMQEFWASRGKPGC
jgi:hypothetical protein